MITCRYHCYMPFLRAALPRNTSQVPPLPLPLPTDAAIDGLVEWMGGAGVHCLLLLLFTRAHRADGTGDALPHFTLRGGGWRCSMVFFIRWQVLPTHAAAAPPAALRYCLTTCLQQHYHHLPDRWWHDVVWCRDGGVTGGGGEQAVEQVPALALHCSVPGPW